MAESIGFEPMKAFYCFACLANKLFKPLTQLSIMVSQKWVAHFFIAYETIVLLLNYCDILVHHTRIKLVPHSLKVNCSVSELMVHMVAQPRIELGSHRFSVCSSTIRTIEPLVPANWIEQISYPYQRYALTIELYWC